MNIVNLIHIGDEVKNFADMSPEEKEKVAIALNTQALKQLGYEVRTEEETA